MSTFWGEQFYYLPMAFFIPPSQFFVHAQFNLLYQFWIHTEVIDDLGPLEWIINTPSHHRVHHGINAINSFSQFLPNFVIFFF